MHHIFGVFEKVAFLLVKHNGNRTERATGRDSECSNRPPSFRKVRSTPLLQDVNSEDISVLLYRTLEWINEVRLKRATALGSEHGWSPGRCSRHSSGAIFVKMPAAFPRRMPVKCSTTPSTHCQDCHVSNWLGDYKRWPRPGALPRRCQQARCQRYVGRCWKP